jgi:hypothetical protein
MKQENIHLTEVCGNCGFTFGSHCGGGHYSSFYKMYIPKDYCPGHEGRMDWDKGKGTTFLATNTFKEKSESE